MVVRLSAAGPEAAALTAGSVLFPYSFRVDMFKKTKSLSSDAACSIAVVQPRSISPWPLDPKSDLEPYSGPHFDLNFDPNSDPDPHLDPEG